MSAPEQPPTRPVQVKLVLLGEFGCALARGVAEEALRADGPFIVGRGERTVSPAACPSQRPRKALD